MRALMIVCLALFVAACSSTSGEEGASAEGARPVEEPKIDTSRPDGMLKELYTSYFTVLNNGGAAEQGNYVDKYFAPDLAAKFAAASSKPESRLTFDIFINAQDHRELTLVSVKRALENPERAIYEVRFINDGEEQKVRVGLIKTGDAWKITDIEYGPGLALSVLLK
jgi:hypothetical protein